MDRLNTETSEVLNDPRSHCDASDSAAPELLDDAETRPSLQERMARIVRTIEADIIPRLVRSHRGPAETAATVPAAALGPLAIADFVRLVLADGDTACGDSVARLRGQGVSAETIFLDLLAPAARELGRLWEEDLCTFSDVTVGLGRLQRIVRGLSAAFGTEVDIPADGRRALLLPAPGEQHTFGLSMVAEFFRRAGWDVVCELDARTVDPVALVRSEWFDVIGISAGVDARVDWLRSGIAAVRHASRNRAIGVMVGGPIFSGNPQRVAEIGADATATDGRQAPAVAEQLLDERVRRL